jgi:hypothetical protein
MVRKKNHKTRAIVVEHLEKIGANVFDDYSSVITDLIKGRQGIYALYNNERLYYVGLASNLKSRVKTHNRDRHQGKWTHFSLYIIRKEDHVKEIESLALRISRPKGNKVKGKLKKSKNLRPLFKRMFREEQIKQRCGIFGENEKNTRRVEHGKRKIKKTDKRPLQGYFPEGKVIHANYKGKEYKAWVCSNGRIKVNGKIFDSPSLAGLEVTKKQTMNGWRFWKYKDKNGELVYIDQLRK